MVSVPCIRIHPNNVCLYSQLYTESGELYIGGREGIKSERFTNCHRLSVQSKKKLNRAITYMCHLSKPQKIKGVRYAGTMDFKISFVTLTLSSTQLHDDNTIKKTCLLPFIDYCRKVYKAERFIWKAERQKNGNLHFHLLFDKFIPYQVIKEKWNKYQNKLNYIDNYFANSYTGLHFPSLGAAYKSINSTDVHSVRKISDLHRYLCKYFLKSSNSIRQRIKRNKSFGIKKFVKGVVSVSAGAKFFLKNAVNSGRIWSCSYDLVNIRGAEDLNCNYYYEEINRLIAHDASFVKRESYFTYIGFDYKVLRLLKCYGLINLLSEYLITDFDLLNSD